ncbi:hypothetical protein, partial [Listeria booriae]|nr:hypothetical protein [Listeria booriae]
MEKAIIELVGEFQAGMMFPDGDSMCGIDMEEESQIVFYNGERGIVSFQQSIEISKSLESEIMAIRAEIKQEITLEEYEKIANEFWGNISDEDKKDLRALIDNLVNFYQTHSSKLQFILNVREELTDNGRQKVFHMREFNIILGEGNQSTRYRIPEEFADPIGLVEGYFPVCGANLPEIKKIMNETWKPLKGFKFLALAKHSEDLESKYLLLVTGAELGVKEFFITKNPDLKEILYEINSPPIEKLYGSLMKHYFNIDIPNKNQLKDLVGKRNQIVHRVELKKPLSYEDINHKIM